MKKVGALAIAILLVAGLGGCPTEDGDPAVDLSVDKYCKQLADVACHNMWHCCTGYQIEDMLGITISVEPDECRRDVELLCEDNMATILWAAYKGSVVLVEEDANACFQSLVLAGECFQHVSEVPWLRWCEDDHWRGTLQPGQDCLYSFECQDGAYCAADRKCKAFPKDGQECPAYICAPGLFCNPEDGRCRPKRSSGLECQAEDWCADGMYCEYNNEPNPVCMGRKSLGVGCKGHYQCESSFCIPGLCQTGGECFEDSECAGTCGRSGNYCGSDYDCPGQCQFSGYSCESDWDCSENESCLTDSCNQQCSGQSVCAEAWTVIDYCEDALGMLFDGQGEEVPDDL